MDSAALELAQLTASAGSTMNAGCEFKSVSGAVTNHVVSALLKYVWQEVISPQAYSCSTLAPDVWNILGNACQTATPPDVVCHGCVAHGDPVPGRHSSASSRQLLASWTQVPCAGSQAAGSAWPRPQDTRIWCVGVYP